MTKRDLEFIKQRFPMSAATIKRNADIVGGLQNTVPERRVQENALVAGEGKEKSPSCARFRVVVTSFRCRLTDLDNLCPKWLIDALRYKDVFQTIHPITSFSKFDNRRLRTNPKKAHS